MGQTIKFAALGAAAFMVLDGLWLGLLMKNFYRDQLAPIVRLANGGIAPNWPAAVVVYALLGTGIALFVIPHASTVPLAAVRSMGRQHPGLVAVTTGEDGAFWRAPMGDRVNHVRPRRVEAVDTLAAGDVFHGAFALRIAEGANYFDAFEFAAVAAAIKCTRFGGRLGAPTRAEVEAMLA